jgi:hypothetical protein
MPRRPAAPNIVDLIRCLPEEEAIMRFDECREGDYRIYVGALDAPRGAGYIAALVVRREPGVPIAPREAFRDDSLACGYRWGTADEAIRYAMNRARELIRSRSAMLVC